MRRRALLSIAGTIVATTTAGCTDAFLDGSNTVDDASDSEDETRSSTPTPTPAPTFDAGSASVELLDHELVRTNAGASDELVAVAGTVRNTGDESLSGLTLRVQFLDATGESLATTTIDVRTLAVGRSWTFESTYPGTGAGAADVADYRLIASADE
ncbi:FxLYD domain-containing protein [Haloprofundus salinisoli]|uniref:FxLYD domain-containing protein n=1 Tax=Haloprofundus salinisoli TaxID=2876193 RepID=UPI001CCDF835|nr:FxLYD domain-containing protein [Haloprofundus salinisoli]